MNETVAIIGGGIAGLSAAHELVKRGFKVEVYERRSAFGGKAASSRVSKDRAADAGKDGLPGEHGFRFFPGWYRHLFETLEEIPFQEKKTLYQGATVADNLVQVRTNRLAWLGRPAVDLPLQIPRSASEAVTATNFLAVFRDLGLSAGEVTLFFRKLLEVAALPESSRIDKLEKISWWEFLECPDPARSQAYKDFIRATTRTMVAAKAEEASAYTIGRVAVRTFLDTLTSVDRVLNGPTSEVWIDPWITHLRNRGVKFHPEMELEAIQFDAKARCVSRVLLEPVVVADVRRLRGLISRATKRPGEVGDSDINEMTSLIEDLSDGGRFRGIVATDQLDKLPELLHDAKTSLGRIWPRVAEAQKGLKELQQQLEGRRPVARDARLPKAVLRDEVKARTEALAKLVDGLGKTLTGMKELHDTLAQVEALGRQHEHPVKADYFVFALPLEQLAYHVNRSQMLTFLAPELRDVVRLARHMDWMSGIQFYLNAPVSFSPGHLVGMDSPWALTAIESTRFWKSVDLPTGVKAVLSVDISAWDRRGLEVRKEAFNCTDDEIAIEVWHQLEQLLNRKDLPAVLRPDMLVGGALKRNVSYHLDESVVDLRDRKKQAFYELARGARFNTLDLVQQGERTDGSDPEERYMWGPRLRFNAEPLLINRPGSQQLRPQATTAISNLFLAGDYIRTESDLASMEGANESARRAVNGILKIAGSQEEPCPLYPFSPGRQVAGAVITLGGALRGLDGATAAVSGLQNRLWKRVALGVMRVQGRRELP